MSEVNDQIDEASELEGSGEPSWTERLGNAVAVRDLTAKVEASSLDPLVKASLLQDNPPTQAPDTDASCPISSPTFTAA